MIRMMACLVPEEEVSFASEDRERTTWSVSAGSVNTGRGPGLSPHFEPPDWDA